MDNVIDINRKRQPQGIRTGGQFAATAHGEAAGVTLAAPAPAPAQPEKAPVPEKLLMAHFQDPRLAFELEWEVKRAVETGNTEYNREGFAQHLPNLPREEALDYFDQALEADRNGTGSAAVCAEAAERDAEAHPGGKLEGGYTPPGGTSVPGYQYGTLSTGGRYTGFRDATAIAADIRTELKAATAGNYLPKGLAYSVKTEKYSGGQSIHVTIQGLPDEDRLDAEKTDNWGDPAPRDEAVELQRRVQEITDAFNRQDTDSMSDYFNVTYYGFARIEDDRGRQFRESEAEARRLRRKRTS